MKFLNGLLLLFFFHSTLSGQIRTIPPQSFDSLFNKERVYYLQDDGKTYYGCGYNLEGIPLNLLFTRIMLDTSKREMHLVGYVHMGMNKKDTIGIPYLNVFFAKPKGNILINKKNTVNLSAKKNTLELTWNPETGFFDILFYYQKDMNLYFDSGGIFCTRELFFTKLFEK